MVAPADQVNNEQAFIFFCPGGRREGPCGGLTAPGRAAAAESIENGQYQGWQQEKYRAFHGGNILAGPALFLLVQKRQRFPPWVDKKHFFLPWARG